MTPTFSIYLDLVRVIAALMVLLFHGSFDRFGGNWLKPMFGGSGTDGVVIFFVLSGLVISWAAETKERDPYIYFTNRLARLWSVAIPALMLTLAADSIGRMVDPSIYPDFYPTDHVIGRLVAAGAFVNELWFWSIQPLSNAPFWSLCYEFWYYACFGVYFLIGGRSGTILAILAIVIMGPKLMLLWPIWLMGTWVHRNARTFKLSVPPATLALLSAPIGIALMHQMGISFRFQWRISSILGDALGHSIEFVTANVTGVLVALHLIGFVALERYFAPALSRLERPVRFIAGYTLSIYLYHFPLLHMFGAIIRPGPADTFRSIAILLCTLAVSIALGSVTEKKKGVVRALIEAGLTIACRLLDVKRPPKTAS